MADENGTGGRPGINFGKSVLFFGLKFWIGVVISGAVIVWAVSTSEKPEAGFQTGALVVVGGIIGILFAPSPKPADHGLTASTSVERMMDMANELSAVQISVTDVITEVEDPIVKMRLVAAQDKLVQQEERLQRNVADWDVVSPGVVSVVRERLDVGKIRFKELMERGQDE